MNFITPLEKHSMLISTFSKDKIFIHLFAELAPAFEP